MQVLLPPAASLMSTGHWCHLLASRIANTSSIEWAMRLQRSASTSRVLQARFNSGIPMERHQVGTGTSPWFSAADVAAWFAGMGYTVVHEEVSAEATPAEPVTLAAPEAAQESEHPPSALNTRAWHLSSPEVAQAFADLRGWKQDVWASKCGDPPDWLAAARVIPGQRGVTAATWDPVQIANALVDRFSVPTRTVRARFQTDSLLKPWLAAWKEHEATYFADE